MEYKKVLKEVLNLLFWCMLAAATVGPGTVVTCARAGAEFQLKLIWALLFATFMAYTLMEGTSRLTIISGKNLGECLQIKYKRGKKIWNVCIQCWVVAVSVTIGLVLGNCNNWAGGMAAIYSLPGVTNTDALRVGCCVAYGVVALSLNLMNKTDILGVGLGVMLIGMIILFLVVVSELSINMEEFAWGMIPYTIPKQSLNIILSLIGTTAGGAGLFLGSAMSKGKELQTAQRGIAFSVCSTLVVSVLIMLVGDGTYHDGKGEFDMATLSKVIIRTTGAAGIWVFGLGFIAAAMSSMITGTMTLGIVVDSLFTINKNEDDVTIDQCKEQAHNKQEPQIEMKEMKEMNETMVDQLHINTSVSQVDLITAEVNVQPSEAVPLDRPFPIKYKNGLMVFSVIIPVIVISLNISTVQIIMIVQVFNACLLPFFSTCLLVCINDPQFMAKRPQHGWANCFLIFAVTVTLFLTIKTLTQIIFSWIVTKNYMSETNFEIMAFSLAGGGAVLLMTTLCFCTTFGKQLRRSFRKNK